MASLFVIQGADQGRRFELRAEPMPIGRDAANPIRLHDNEVSRRHAELRPGPEGHCFRVVDLGSANGTFLNGQPIDEAPLRAGDRLQVGQTVLLYGEGPGRSAELTERVDLLGRASPQDRSAIVRTLTAEEADAAPGAADSAGDWLRARLAHLSVMYQATQAISHILDPDELLGRVLELVFESIGADRGTILLADPRGELAPRAVRWRQPKEAGRDERLTISRTIVEHVRETGQGVITTDAPADRRFGPSQSIVDFAIREAICVPIRGRHSTLGVLYADALGGAAALLGDGAGGRSRFTNEHLALMVAIGNQAGLALENTEFHQAKIQAERLAAVGQAIATISHHIKNVLQGLHGGSHLIDLGLNRRDESTVRRGWAILEKNQAKIYNLVLDMLTLSKDREPALEQADLNRTVADVVELMQARADELGVALHWRPASDPPSVLIDPEAIHRAVLNIVTNALDASEGVAGARVEVATHWDAARDQAVVVVRDNGIGIAEADLPGLFELFSSTKGTRGTGLGLPVSQKIVREHGGRIAVQSRVGAGATFTLELPQRRCDVAEGEGHGTTS